jgi:hypothetical protein
VAASGLDGEIKLVLSVVEQPRGLFAVALLVEVIGGARAVQFVDGILNMVVYGVEVVPVVDLGDGDSASKGEGKCGDHVEILHRSFSPRGDI